MILLSFIDSHTGGEPTRLVTHGFPDLGGGTVAEQATVFARDFDHYRRAIVMSLAAMMCLLGRFSCHHRIRMPTWV